MGLAEEMKKLNDDPLGACEVCWTNSWEPCDEEENCAYAHPHLGDCVRCLCCWLTEENKELQWMLDELQK